MALERFGILQAPIPRNSVPTRAFCGLTGVAADAGAVERAEALASLVSTARVCLIRRS
jgi:hypothetical protein